MVDRFLVWLCVGILTAGAATITGAGLAAAEDGAATVAGGNTSSETSNTTGAEADSEGGDRADADSETGDDATSDAGADDTEKVDKEADGEEAAAGDVEDAIDDEGLTDVFTSSHESKSDFTNRATVDTDTDHVANDITDATAAKVLESDANRSIDRAADEPGESTAIAVEAEPQRAVADRDDITKTLDTESKTEAARLVMTAAAEEPAAAPSLINVVGSFFWGLLDLFSTLAVGPPVVPPGSAVRAGRSTLQIDCGDGYTAEADWYFPTEVEPDKFIYFQHGFAARAAVYNVTLADLAERNNAVVVAPSITSNIFACDGCNLTTGEPMHAAVARLFEGDRAALVVSARAAGYEGTLPEQFVIAGQSGGAMLAQGAAGYYWQFAPVDEKSNLAGALLFDTSATGGGLARALDKLPPTVPVLLIAAAPNPLNFYGGANQVFAEKRPGQFNGIQLVGGAHSDGFRSSILFGIPQIVVSLVFGASTPENVEAVQVLAEGWITDMYERRVYDPATRTGIYGDPGEPGEVVVDIPTDAGVAHGYVLPGPTYQPSLIDVLIGTVVNSPGYVDFATCAVDPSGSRDKQACAA